MMKLYEYPGAPNPRRVKIFLAEKNLAYKPMHCDIVKGEHKTPDFLEKFSSGKIPVLELDDGRCLGESVAICRYLEAVRPEPNLFGRDAFELGFVEMRNRQIELELWMQIGISWVNGPIVAKLGRFTQNQLAKDISDKNVVSYYQRLNTELASTAYVAGDRFTIADISLLTAVDFATALVGLKPAESNEALWTWHRRVSERESISEN